jgi:hypothetical protein
LCAPFLYTRTHIWQLARYFCIGSIYKLVWLLKGCFDIFHLTNIKEDISLSISRHLFSLALNFFFFFFCNCLVNHYPPLITRLGYVSMWPEHRKKRPSYFTECLYGVKSGCASKSTLAVNRLLVNYDPTFPLGSIAVEKHKKNMDFFWFIF